jgi:sugar phosphate isomerase/epimerase
VNVQIEDMCRGAHAHLEFGQGEIDFPPVLAALSEAGYAGLISVELPRHSHTAPDVAERSLAFLRRAAR